MIELELIKANNTAKIIELCNLIKTIWSECFYYFPKEKLNYLLFFIEHDVIKDEIKKDGMKYFFIKKENENVGLVSYKEEKDFILLSKIYILKKYLNKGIGKNVINIIKKFNKKIKTYVQKDDKIIEIFLHLGFKQIKTTVLYIGSNFTIECCVMEYDL